MMGMVKISRGSGFRGALDYALGKGQLIGGNMSGINARELATEFKAVRELRPDIAKPVWHEALRLPIHEKLSISRWHSLADDFMRRLGFDDLHPRAYVLHDDAEGQHIHIVASRIALNKKIFLGQNENLKATTAMRELEREYGLTVYTPDPDKPRRKSMTRGEKGLAERTHQIPLKIRIQAIIDQAVVGRPPFSLFKSRLEKAGVTCLPSGKTGEPQGVSFALDGMAFKGSDLGKSYAWKGLTSRIEYDPDRDQRMLDELRQSRAEEQVIGEIKPGPSTNPPSKTKKRTLDLAFEESNGTWRWRRGGRVAFVDHGNRISVLSQNETAIKASLQLARQKWGHEVAVSGHEDYRRHAWLIGSLMGLNVKGYEPNLKDLTDYKRLQVQRKVEYDRKISADANGSRGRGKDSDHRGISQVGGTDGRRSESYSGTDTSSDGTSQGSESAVRQQFGQTGDLQTARADYSRSPHLANVSGVRPDRSDIRNVRVAAQSISDIAAAIIDQPTDGSERRNTANDHQEQLQPDHTAKINAWKRQSQALGAEKYRITLKPRAENAWNGRKLFDQNYGNPGAIRARVAAGVLEKFWTRDEITAEIAKLRAKSAQGYDIYITPMDDSKHFIVVDDMTPEKEKSLLNAGIKPAIIQKTSEGSKQAIIIIDRMPGKEEQKWANQLDMMLNKKFGDEKISGVIYPFRMAGSSHKNAEKENCLTIIEMAIHRKCELLSAFMNKIRNDHRYTKRDADQLIIEQPMKDMTDQERHRL